MTHHIDAISSVAETAGILSRLSEILRPMPRGFWLKKKAEWVAVPLERSMHLDIGLQRRMVAAFSATKIDTLYAVAFELQDSLVPAYRLQISAAGMAAFNNECGQFDYVLCPLDLSALVFCCASGDYLAAVGTPALVEAVAGAEARDLCIEFAEYAADSAWSSAEALFLSSLRSVLCDDYSSASDGSAVTFPKG